MPKQNYSFDNEVFEQAASMLPDDWTIQLKISHDNVAMEIKDPSARKVEILGPENINCFPLSQQVIFAAMTAQVMNNLRARECLKNG